MQTSDIIQLICSLAIIFVATVLLPWHLLKDPLRKKQGGYISLASKYSKIEKRRAVYVPPGRHNRLQHRISPSKNGPLIIVKNANTILSLDIIAQRAMRTASAQFFRIDQMTHDVSNEFKAPGDKVKVSVPGSFTAADCSSHYVAQNASETAFEVELDSNMGSAIHITDAEARSKGLEYYDRRFATPLMISVRSAIASSLSALVPGTGGADNFATTYDMTVTAANFGWDDVCTAGVNLDTAKVGPNRHMVVKPAYKGKLLQDSVVLALIQAGAAEGMKALREGFVGRLNGMDTYSFADWPTTSNNQGAYWAAEAFCFAAAQQLEPDAGNVEVITLIDEDGEDANGNFYTGTGLPFQFRRVYNSGVATQAAIDDGYAIAKGYTLSAEALYGIVPAVKTALGRIKSA